MDQHAAGPEDVPGFSEQRPICLERSEPAAPLPPHPTPNLHPHLKTNIWVLLWVYAKRVMHQHESKHTLDTKITNPTIQQIKGNFQGNFSVH